jgi:hypothetical protein
MTLKWTTSNRVLVVELTDLVTFSYFARYATRERVADLGERPAQLRERPAQLRERVAASGENGDKRREDFPATNSMPSQKLISPPV